VAVIFVHYSHSRIPSLLHSQIAANNVLQQKHLRRFRITPFVCAVAMYHRQQDFIFGDSELKARALVVKEIGRLKSCSQTIN